MKKHFNTAGPCQPDIHYMLSSVERMPQIKSLIEQRNYFVIHAPRQATFRQSPPSNAHQRNNYLVILFPESERIKNQWINSSKEDTIIWNYYF